MGYISFRVPALQVEGFIVGLEALEVGLRVVRELEALTDADVLGAPVIIAGVNGHACLPRDEVEPRLPAFDGLAGAFGGDGEVELLGLVHLLDQALDEGGGIAPVHGDAADAAQEPATGKKKNSFLIITCYAVEGGVEKVGDDEVLE